MLNPKIKVFLIFNFSLLIFNFVCFADTIYLNNGEERKGIVVEDYVDRIKLSTENGEQEILKADIKDILYDLRAQNLIKLGDFHNEKGNLARAYVYYRKAYLTDPAFEPAVARYNYITSILLRQPHEQLEERINKQKALMRAARGIIEVKEGISSASEQQLKKLLGIELLSKDERPYVNKVNAQGSAYKAGVREGDFIIAVWNRLTGYMELEDMSNLILRSKTGEVKLTVERTLKLAKSQDPEYVKGGLASLGFSLDLTPKGLLVNNVLGKSVAESYGLTESDVVDKINNQSTRYMPLKKVIELIESSGGEVAVTIQRDISLWLGRG